MGTWDLVWVCTLWVTIVMWPAPVKNSGPPRLEWASLSAQLERSMHLWDPHRGRTGKPMLTSLVFAYMYHYSAVPALCPLLHKSWLRAWLCWVTSPSSNSLVGGHGTRRQPPFWTAALPSCLWYHSSSFSHFLVEFFFFSISFFGFYLYQTQNITVSSGSILALFYLYYLVRLFYNPIGFNAIYMLMTLKLISTAKTFLQTPPTHMPTGHSNWMSIKDFKFLKTV